MFDTVLFRLGAYAFSAHAAASFGVGLLVGVVGLATLALERSSEESVSFFLLSLAAALWLAAFGWMYAAPDAAAAERWARAAYLGVPLIPAAAHRFSLRLRPGGSRRRRAADALLWGTGLAFAVLVAATDLLVVGVESRPWGWYPRFLPAGLLLALFTAGGLGAAVLTFWRGWREAGPGRERHRFGWLLVAFAVGFFALLDWLPAFGFAVVPVGYLFVAGFLALIAWTVVRYRFVRYTPAFAGEGILRTLADPLVVCDSRDRIRLVNDAVSETLGYRPEELVGRPLTVLAPDRAGGESALLGSVRSARVRSRELELRAADGEEVAVSLSVSPLEDRDGSRVGSVAIARDIRRRKAVEREAERRAREDALTGLHNRRSFREAVTRALEAAEAGEGADPTVIHLGLRGFAAVNDALGHAAGDEVLREVARRLEAAVRDGDTTARVGGDEFACLLAGDVAREELEEVLARLEEALRQPLRIRDTDVRLRAGIGIAGGGPDRFGPDDLLRAATLAERRARDEDDGTVCHRFFEPERDGAISDRLHRENELRRALRRGELFPVYQPVVSLADGRVEAFEALVRWRHPERGVLGPGQFLELAEDLGLLGEVGRRMLEAACNRAVRWRDAGGAGATRAAVNLSAAELASPALPDVLETALEISGLDPDGLMIEITESTAIEQPDRLHRISELGVAVALDDFGTGFSSLAYLARLPLDVLKLDRSFVHRLEDDEPTRAVVRAVVDVAAELDSRVVAEGIETPGQAAMVRELGCELGQGFHFARPMEADDTEALLEAGSAPGRAAS